MRNLPPNYAVYAVDQCANAEGVAGGTVPGFYPSEFNGTIAGVTAITYDMIGYNSGTIFVQAQCFLRH